MVRTICQNSIAHVARLQSIDVLRACAALSVIGVSMASFGPHGSFSQGWLPNIYPVLAAGHGVPLFFVISGFCIHLRWAKQYAQTGTATTDFLGFWKRRLFRLYPPYFVMLCLCMAVIFLEILLGINSKAVTSYPHPRGLWAGIDFLMHALMLHGLSPRFDFSAGNDPFWSLAREEYFYLMYFALLSWRRAAGMLKALLVVLVLGVVIPWGLKSYALSVNPGDPTWMSDHWYPLNTVNSALVLWIQWTLGMVAVEAYYGIISLPRWCYAWWLCLLCAGSGFLSEHFVVPVVKPLLWGMAFFILVNICVRCEQQHRWPTSRVFRWLAQVGIFSYSLYLTHAPLLSIVSKLESFVRAKIGITVITPLYFAVAYTVMVIAAYYCGKIYFLFIERWFLPNRRDEMVSQAPGMKFPESDG